MGSTGATDPAAVAGFAVRAFADAYRRQPDVTWSAPGRANLIGEHTDYNEGWVLPAAIDRRIAIGGCKSREPFVTLYSTHHGGRAKFSSTPEDMLSDRTGRLPLWARYVRATLAELVRAGHWSGAFGFSGAISGDVPVGGGLSSSAALTVACATFALALQGDTLPPLDIARVCQHAEWAGAGVRVGIMDPAASALGRARRAILLDCRSLEYSYVPADIPHLRILIFDTGVPHTLATSGYNERRSQCEDAVRRLTPLIQAIEPGRAVTALRDVTADDLERFGAQLPDVQRRRAQHVVFENQRTLAAASALRAGDVEALGALLDKSHVSLRDLYQVSCVELDTAVDIMRACSGVYGARMMGAGFGGSALALVDESAIDSVQAALARAYHTRTGTVGKAYLCRISDGAQWRAIELDT